ncbi:hypothetical protein M569_13291 [Genlisea aurea]|uniref:Reverse transcriptase Ty1/copia-type domain-containing protein n=1 Tax=Genlisea aurea TaxID=192259 RepID=S8CAV5_9LAMI|nr:hypothetical protein M569_13291 [Genlisea aurea]
MIDSPVSVEPGSVSDSSDISSNSSAKIISPLLRRSDNVHRPPSWLKDYTNPEFSPDSTCLTNALCTAVALVTTIPEPQTYHDAKGIPEWEKAMSEELQGLEENKTWVLVDKPPDCKPIGCKWVYRVKLNPDGSISRYKACLVAKGFTQVEVVDYYETYAPVAKMVTIRVVLALTASHSWYLHQLDVNNAFLHGHLDETVYMIPPDGYSEAKDGQVFSIHKIEDMKDVDKNDVPAYALVGSDNPGVILFVVLLTPLNFMDWSRSMTLALDCKDKLGFINGTLSAPSSDSPHFRAWQKADSMVRSCILNSMSRDLVHNFNKCLTARDMWLSLERHFVCSACHSVVDANTALDAIKLTHFLSGLTDVFTVTRDMILSMHPAPNLEAAYGILLNIEPSDNKSAAIESSALLSDAAHTPIGSVRSNFQIGIFNIGNVSVNR